MIDRAVYTLENLHELAGETPLYGVIGYPVAHSKSPQMQQAAFATCDLPARYVRIEASPDQLLSTVKTMRDLQFRGWNCTVPHKVEMLRFVQTWDDSVNRARAINTVVNLGDELRGYSTDGSGWVAAVRECFGVEVRDLKILLLGAGGSGQTLAREAVFAGCRRLVITNRAVTKAETLVRSIKQGWAGGDLSAIPWDDGYLEEALRETDLLVNTTTVGLNPLDPCVISPALLRSDLLIYDLVYQKNSTPLILAARSCGARAADGLSMLLHQGAAAFTIWTGRTAPITAMREALFVG